MPDHKSWHVTDEAIISELIELMGLNQAETSALAAMAAEAKTVATAMVDEFYQRLHSHENTLEYLERANSDRLKGMVGAWWNDIFVGVYDTQYAMKRIEIGHVHVRIGLPVRYPIAMLDIVMKHGLNIAANKGEVAQSAFRKIIALDVAIFNQAYENHQLKHLSELVGNERLARRLLAGQG